MVDDEPSSDEWTTGRVRIGERSEIAEIRRLYAAGKIDQAMKLAETLRSRKGVPLTAVPVVIVTPEALMRLPLDHRAGFMLTRIDGVSTVQAIIDISAMPADEAISVLEKLITVGALGLSETEDDKTLERAHSSAPPGPAHSSRPPSRPSQPVANPPNRPPSIRRRDP